MSFPPQQEFIFIYALSIFCKYLIYDISDEKYRLNASNAESELNQGS